MSPIAESRRAFLKTLVAGAGATVLGNTVLTGCTAPGRTAEGASDPWRRVQEILRHIKAPEFPERDFQVTAFGAVGDGKMDCTDAFARAVTACNQAGGGRVVVPAGTFLTGPIHLRSNVNLHLAEGSTILFSQDTTKYLPAVFTRWEGVELMNYSPFIYAFEQENVAITGTGVLDGQSDQTHWWPWKQRGRKEGDPSQDYARKRLFDMAERGVPVAERVFGEGDYLRPQFIQPYRCKNVLIEGVKIRRSPMWEIHPVLCENVTVRDVHIETHGPNNDGCDPESCKNVLIEGCYFDTGDDCIALKSGRNADGRRVNVPIENVVIRNCRMKDGHGGVTIGSEISGGARNIFAEDCEMDSPNLERALRIKTNSVRGGVVEDVYMRNVRVGQVSNAAVWIDFLYEEGDAGVFEPIVRRIEVRDLTCRKAEYALFLRGYEDSPIQDVRLVNCTFEEVEKENLLQHVVGLKLEGVKVEGQLVRAA